MSSSFGQGNINVNISGNAQGLVTAMNQADQSVRKTTTSIQQGMNKTGGATTSLAEKFSGNRGLIYSMGTIFGTITGVVAEFQLLEEANNSVAEATGKLTEMEAKGEQGTTQYSQAQQQLEKAQRFLRFTTRNLALAVTNFIPEILLLVTSLSKAKVAAEAAGPAFKEVGAVSKAVAAETTIANTALNSQAGSFAIMSKNAKAVKPALTEVGVAADGVGVAVAKSGNIFTKFIGIITNKWFIVLAAASAALLAFVENWGGFRDIVNQAGVALGNFAPILKGILEPMGKFGDWLAETLGNKAKTGTDEAKKGFKGLSKEAVKAAEDVQKAWEETLDNLVEMTKKERLKYLKDLGFGKSGRKKLQLGIEIVQDKQELFKQLEESLSIVNEFHLNKKDTAKWAGNMIEDIRDAMKDAGGKLDFMQGLIDVIKQNKDKGPEALRTAVAKWFQGLPANVKAQLAKEKITEKELLTNMGLNPETFGKGIQTAISDSVARVDMFKALEGLGAAPGSRFNPDKIKKGVSGGATGIIDGLIKSIEGAFTPEKLSAAATTFADAFISSIKFTADKLQGLITYIEGEFKKLFTKQNFATAGTLFADAFLASVVFTAQGLQDLLTRAQTNFIKLFSVQNMKDVGTKVGASMAQAIDFTVEFLTPIVTKLSDGLKKLFTPTGMAAAAGSIQSALMDAFVTIVEDGKYLIKGVGAFIEGFMKGFKPETLSGVADAIIKGIQATFTEANLKTAGATLLSALVASAKFVGEGLQTLLTYLSGEFTKLFTADNLAKAGEALLNAVIGAAQAIGNLSVKFATWLDSKLAELFTADNIKAAGKALMDGLIAAAQAIGNLSAKFATWLAGKLSEIFTPKNMAEAGAALLNAMDAAAQAVVGAFTDLGKWVGEQLSKTFTTDNLAAAGKSLWEGLVGAVKAAAGAIGGAWDFITKVFGITPAEAGTPKGKDDKPVGVQNVDVSANGDIAKGIMTSVLEWWKRIAGDIQGLIPQLNVDPKPANDTITAVLAWWKRIGGDIQGIIPALKVNNKDAIKMINAVYAQWKRIVGDIKGLVAVPKVNPKPAKDALTEIYKWAKRIVGDINGLTGTIKIKYDVEKKPAGLTHMSSADFTHLSSNANAHASSNGMLNVTIVNEDEFGQKKLKRFRSQLGKESYRFG